jgi:hypothetical protein
MLVGSLRSTSSASVWRTQCGTYGDIVNNIHGVCPVLCNSQTVSVNEYRWIEVKFEMSSTSSRRLHCRPHGPQTISCDGTLLLPENFVHDRHGMRDGDAVCTSFKYNAIATHLISMQSLTYSSSLAPQRLGLDRPIANLLFTPKSTPHSQPTKQSI